MDQEKEVNQLVDEFHQTFDELDKAKPQSTSAPKPEPEKPNYKGIPDHCKAALEEKDLGNDAYKKKDFDNALKHYQRAIELDPTNIIFYVNLAAVYLAQKEYEKCIKECETAVVIGRQNGADCKLIAKAFARMGNAYKAMEQWKLAKKFYEKSISEYQCAETKELLEEVETRIFLDETAADEGEGDEIVCNITGITVEDFMSLALQYNKRNK